MGKAPEFLRGIFAPVTTPFTGDGEELALEQLQRNIQMYLTSPLDGFVVLGSTGEFPHLTFEEKVKAIAAAVEAAEEKPVIAGTGCPSTRETIALTREAARAGARAVLVVTPYYYRNELSGDALYEHFAAVADASPVPVLLYQYPQLTGVEIPADVVLDLAEHPNIVGMKDSSGHLARFTALAAALPEEFALFVGSASLLLPALLAGAKGGILALADALPWECCEIYRLFREGRVAEAAERQRRLTAVSEKVSRFGIAGIKALMDLHGYYGGPVRRPLLPLTEEDMDTLRALLREHRLMGC